MPMKFERLPEYLRAALLRALNVSHALGHGDGSYEEVNAADIALEDAILRFGSKSSEDSE